MWLWSPVAEVSGKYPVGVGTTIEPESVGAREQGKFSVADATCHGQPVRQMDLVLCVGVWVCGCVGECVCVCVCVCVTKPETNEQGLCGGPENRSS